MLVFSLIDCAVFSTLPIPHPAVRYIEPGDHAFSRTGIFLNVYYLFRLSLLFYCLYFVRVCECGVEDGWPGWLES